MHADRKPWTSEEVEFLLANNAEMTCAQLAQALSRSRSSIQQKRYKLGCLKGWTDDEISVLKRYVGVKPVRQIADMLLRSRRSVAMKIFRLGLGAKKVDDSFSLSQLARLTRVSRWRIERVWIKKLGLPFFRTEIRTGKADLRLIRKDDLLIFFEEHPDALDFNKLPESCLEDLGVLKKVFGSDSYRRTIPLPPKKKRVTCSCGATWWVTLFENLIHCKKCGVRIFSYGVEFSGSKGKGYRSVGCLPSETFSVAQR